MPTETKLLKRIDKQHMLEVTLRKLCPQAKEIRVRGTIGFDLELEDGFIFQVIKEDYGVSFYIEEQPPDFLLTYEIAGETHRKIFKSEEERSAFYVKLPPGIEASKLEID